MKHFFPNVQHFLEFYFRIRILIGNSSSVYLFLTIFYNKTLRKRKFKMPCFQALGVSAGIAAQPPKKNKNQRQERTPATLPQNHLSATQESEHCQ